VCSAAKNIGWKRTYLGSRAFGLLEVDRMPAFINFSGLILAGTIFGSAATHAQSAGSDEIIQPGGAAAQSITLTTAQKKSIYNAVFQQPVKSYTFELATSVGADVPPSVELTDLPGDIIGGEPWAAGLKYAMAGDNMIVVVDPVYRRIVDVIHGGALP
jgi:hypothetical protein